MSSRRSTSHDEPGPSKRQKVYRACLACVNSKTRCEDVLPRDGCLRCRSKSKSCSLIRPEPHSPRSQPHESETATTVRLAEMEAEWNVLRQRLDRLENDMSARPLMTTMPSVRPPMITMPSDSVTHLNTPASYASPRPLGIHAIFTTLQWQSIALTERVFNVSSDLGYPDPVSRGIVSSEEMELAFHLFKHRFSNLIPLTPYLSSSTPTPTHPFVMLVVLAHAAPSSQLWPLIEEAILAVTSGAVGPEIPLALLILSLAPSPTDSTRAPMTAVRTIALAYSVGQMMGWDTVSEVWCQSRWITLPEWSARLDQLLLWETIKNRYNILCMMQSMSPTLAVSLAAKMPTGVTSQHAQSIAHIKAEAGLVAVFAPILSSICVAEAESHMSGPDLRPLLESWSLVATAFDRWKSDSLLSNMSIYDGYTLRFSLAFRMSCVVQRVPIPIASDSRIAGQSFTGINLLRYSAAILETFNGLSEADLKILPVYLHFQTVVSLSVQQRSLSYSRKQGSDWHLDMVPVLERAVERIKHCIGGLPQKMFEMTDEQYHNDRFIPEMDFEALFAALPEDWLSAFNVNAEWGPGMWASNAGPGEFHG